MKILMTDFGEGLRRKHVKDSSHIVNLGRIALRYIKGEIQNSISGDKNLI